MNVRTHPNFLTIKKKEYDLQYPPLQFALTDIRYG